jgi:hypothetical protein
MRRNAVLLALAALLLLVVVAGAASAHRLIPYTTELVVGCGDGGGFAPIVAPRGNKVAVICPYPPTDFFYLPLVTGGPAHYG